MRRLAGARWLGQGSHVEHPGAGGRGVCRDLLKKHNRPTTLKEMLKASVRAHPDNDPAKPGPAKPGKKRRG